MIRVDRLFNPSQAGVILVIVLWVLVLLSLIATSLAVGGRSFSRQALNAEEGVRAAMAADAGLGWALWHIQLPGGGGWLADGDVRELVLAGVQIKTALFDESGKVDLNSAPTELLDALLASLMTDSRQRAALVAAIEDWRDPDDLVRLNGAEVDDYLAAGRVEGPANRPFQTLVELRQVLGMEEPVFQGLSPSLTLVTRSRTINPQVAPFDVLMALPNASTGVVEAYIEQRREAWADGLPVPELPFDAAPYVGNGRTGVHYLVYTEARLGTRSRALKAVRLQRRGARLELESEVALPPPGRVFSEQEAGL